MPRALPVPVPTQQPNPYWCWAAVASMVSTHYSAGGGQALTPCQVANKTLAFPNCDCCASDPAPDQCQVAWDLPRALNAIGHLGHATLPGNFDTVKGEISQNRLLCALMQYRTGSLHYLLLTGYDETPESGVILLIDPANKDGEVPVPVSSFFSKYDLGQAYWDSWVFTQP